MKKIMTGNYDNCKTGNLVSISGDRGRLKDFVGESKMSLAPKKDFWKIWHDNIGNIDEEDNTRFYVREYYKNVLSKIDPKELYDSLKDETILLCYENNTDFCHRHLVAFYLELFLGIKTSEVRVNSKRQTYHCLERPDYLKKILEDEIKREYDMHGFDDLIDAYNLETCKITPLKYKLDLKSLTK